MLAAVEPALRARVNETLKVVDLRRGDVLYRPGEPVDHVYFPLTGLVGILADTPDGKGLNSSLVGKEGAIGVFEACGSRQFFAEAAVQVAGSAAAMSASDYRSLFGDSQEIRTAVHRYVEQLMNETRQSVVCSAFHAVEARLSRLILEAVEKSGHDDMLPLTQETLSLMLGTQRSTIAGMLSRLQREGIIVTRRGVVAIDDRAGLERRACACRQSIRMTSRSIWTTDRDSCEAAMAAA